MLLDNRILTAGNIAEIFAITLIDKEPNMHVRYACLALMILATLSSRATEVTVPTMDLKWNPASGGQNWQITWTLPGNERGLQILPLSIAFPFISSAISQIHQNQNRITLPMKTNGETNFDWLGPAGSNLFDPRKVSFAKKKILWCHNGSSKKLESLEVVVHRQPFRIVHFDPTLHDTIQAAISAAKLKQVYISVTQQQSDQLNISPVKITQVSLSSSFPIQNTSSEAPKLQSSMRFD